jgi:Tfp pilus assembly protein PilN
MRPVNLLPDDLKPRQASGRLGGSAYAVIGILAALLVMAVGYVLTSNQVNSRKSEIAELQQETADAEARAAKLAPYQAFAQIKATRLESVKTYASQRFDWERLMREVALVLPDGTSVTDLSASSAPQASATAPPATGAPAAGAATTTSSGPSLNLKGCAERQPDVATLMVRLRRLYRAVDVQLTESTEQDSGSGATPLGDSGTGSEGCPPGTYLFDVTVSFSAAEAESQKSVPARLGGGA